VLIDFNDILEQGRLIDNRRTQDDNKITLKDVLISLSKDSDGFKCAVGYFYLEGLALIIDHLRSIKEIKILMGSNTTSLTKKELVKEIENTFNSIEETPENISAVTLFHSLIRDTKTLKILAYFGEENKIERLHSKAYLFLRDVPVEKIFDRYRAGIVGSSNLTPSGLVGNTELNVIITDPRDLRYLESWFDELWQHGSDDFDRLTISEIIASSIEKSKFGSHLKERFVFVEPKEFFKMLIKYMNADYLFEDWKESKLLGFQQIDAIRCLRLFNEKDNRGVFLTSSVGLGKSYVACQIAKYFVNDRRKVLLVAPSGLVENDEQWPRYLREFNLLGNVQILGMGMLQKDPVKFDTTDLHKYEKQYSLIIIDEAHNYRNEDAYRTRNLKRIIDRNGDSRILFLTATPVNTSLDDLLNLIKLFYHPDQNKSFDKLYRSLLDLVSIISNTPYEDLTADQKKKLGTLQQEIEVELFVKSTRETIKTSPDYVKQIKLFSGVDINEIPDPDVAEVVYTLDKKYKEIVNGIVDFIQGLTAAHLRILDPEKGSRLTPFFKWILYKRFESDISSYYLTLKRIHRKNDLIIKAIEHGNVSILDEENMDIENDNQVEVTFTREYKEKLTHVISKIKSGHAETHLEVFKDLKQDLSLIHLEIKKLELFLHDKKSSLFIDDRKLSELLELIRKNPAQKILLFTEYKDTLNAIRQFLHDRFDNETIKFVDSNTKNKTGIIRKFNDKNDKLCLLFTTDSLSEGYNIGGTDLVINFDIPYNPVRLIQRIGRATRLDTPKKIKVFNFRPDEDIDKEIDLVDRIKIRIEDIIRFIGLEYRIWFEKEAELLKERRELDKKIYHEAAKEILKSVRHSLWKGEFDKLEGPLTYINPLLILLQNAISKYNILKNDVVNKQISHNSFTLLKGKKNLTVFYDDGKTFNENLLEEVDINELDVAINFEKIFSNELKSFRDHLEKFKQQRVIESYYNDKIDRMIRSILDKMESEGYEQYLSNASSLKFELLGAKEKCGDQTGNIIRDLHKSVKGKITNNQLQNYIKRLQDSFVRRTMQQKLSTDYKPSLAIGFIEDTI